MSAAWALPVAESRKNTTRGRAERGILMSFHQNEGRPIVGVLELREVRGLVRRVSLDKDLAAPRRLVGHRLSGVVAADSTGNELAHGDGQRLTAGHLRLEVQLVEALHQESRRFVGDGPE